MLATSPRPAEQQLLTTINEDELAFREFRQFITRLIIENQVQRTQEKVREDLAFMLNFFDWFEPVRVQLSQRTILNQDEFGGAIALALDIPIPRVRFVPVGDSSSLSDWVNPKAAQEDFFKLLFGSVAIKARLPEVMKLSRPAKWSNTGRFDQDFHSTIGLRIASCIRSTFRGFGLKSHWSRYTSKLLAGNPYFLLRECVLAYCIGDQDRFKRYKPLCGLSSLALTIGPSNHLKNTWLVLTAAAE